MIPAYEPGDVLIELVHALTDKSGVSVVVVDDGSGPEYRRIFDQVASCPGVKVLRHAINLGKGSALKTGFNFILCRYENALGVITADADGQHHVDDILKLCSRFQQNPDSLLMGVRRFGRDVPMRSRVGNQITRGILKVLVGNHLSDTQTGLRAIPRDLLAGLLRVAACGYEFELEMLLAVKQMGVDVIEEPIRTIYEPGNPTSHFRPLFDSMRIYFVLLRFSLIAVMSAALDNLLFYLLFAFTGSLLQAQVGARIAASLFNYFAVRKAAFRSDERNVVLLPRYLMLVAVNTLVSYAAIRSLTSVVPIGVLPAKILIESMLFVTNFAIQREFIFTRHKRGAPSVPSTARATPPLSEVNLSSVIATFQTARASWWHKP